MKVYLLIFKKRAQIAEFKAAQLEGVVGEYQTLIERLVSEKEGIF